MYNTYIYIYVYVCFCLKHLTQFNSSNQIFEAAMDAFLYLLIAGPVPRGPSGVYPVAGGSFVGPLPRMPSVKARSACEGYML